MMRKQLHLQKTLMFVLLLLGMSSGTLNAQTTVLTTGAPTASSSLGSTAPCGITFVIENTNSYSIVIDSVYMYRASGSSGVTASLFYSSTSLSGPASGYQTSTAWTQIATTTASTVTSTAIHPTFGGLNFTMPGNTTYRFIAMLNVGGLNYGGTSSIPSYSAAGVNLHTGTYQINGQDVGYVGGSGNVTLVASTYGSAFRGTVTFAPASPCIAPPVAGTVNVSNLSPCPGEVISLGLTGGTGGLTQTYDWEESTSPNGPFTSMYGLLNGSGVTDTMGATPGTVYYRCAVDCGSNISYSDTVAVTIPVPYTGGSYTINSAQPTGGSNFNSFTDAMAAIRCGITSSVVLDVVAGSGPYTEQVLIPGTIGTDASKTLTINGNGNTLTFSGNAGSPYTLGIEGADNITVRDLEIIGTNTSYAYGCRIWNGSSNDSFINCSFRVPITATSTTTIPYAQGGTSGQNNPSSGLANSHNVLLNCTMEGGYYCASFYGNSTSKDTGNQILNCRIADFYYYGLYSYYQQDMIVSQDTIERPTRTTLSSFYGLYFSTSNVGLLAEKNILRDPFKMVPTSTSTAYCIYLTSDGTSSKSNQFINNLMYNIEGNGIHYGMYLSGADYVDVYHNTIVMDDANSTGNTTYGIYNTGTVGSINIKNNNVYIARGGSGNKYCLYYTGAGAKSSDNNNLYMVTGTTNFVGHDGSDQQTLSQWQASTGSGSPYDVASHDLDPMFANASIQDFSPANSLLDDMGTPVNVYEDINGTTRSTIVPDIGAYEFTIPACTGTPDSGTIAGPTEACFGIPFTLTASGLSVGMGIVYDWQYDDGAGWISTMAGGYSYPVTSGIYNATNFRVVTYCYNTNQSDTSNVWTVTLKPFYFCYCSPLTGNVLHTSTANYMTKVEILGSPLNNSTASVPAGGYLQTDPNIANQTATVFENVPFTLNTTQSTTLATTEAWFDWDRNGTFDTWEYYPLTSTGTDATATITPPTGFSLGLTGMRIRVAYNSAGAYGSGAPCTNITAGRETEDYVINIAPMPTCPPSSALAANNITTNSADLSWSSISTAGLWEIEYAPGQTSFAQGASGVAPIYTGSNPYTLSNLTQSTVYSFYVRDICGAGDTSYRSGPYAFITDFPAVLPNDSCGTPIDISDGQLYAGTTVNGTQSIPSCNSNTITDDVWYSFTTGSTGGSVTVNVNTTVTDVVIQTLSGTCGGTLTPMIPTASTTLGSNGCIDGPATGLEYGTYTVSANTTYLIRVYTFGTTAQGAFTIQVVGAPLATKLDKLSAANVGASNRVEWNTLSEEHSDKFELERSIDGKTFAKIYEKQANGEPSRYTYMDNNPVKGYNYYRLRMTEANGNATYSEVVKAFVKSAGFEVDAYPNPVSHDLTVKVSGVQGADATILVTDVTGKVISTIKMAGNVETIDMSGLANGIYLIKYSDANHTQTIKVNKQ